MPPSFSPKHLVALFVLASGLWAQTANPKFVYRRPADPTARIERASSFANASIRAQGGAGDDTLTAGFVIAGTGKKPLLIRAIGPGLGRLGVQNAMTTPVLQLNDVGLRQPAAQNRDWRTNANLPSLIQVTNQLGAFTLDSSSADSALLTTMPPGWYTANITGDSGIALIELYDADLADSTRLVNLSTRARVEPGEKTLILGFVVGGKYPKPVLLRGIGPSLANYGVSHCLADPRLAVLNAKGESIASNDDWLRTQPIEAISRTVGGFPLPANSKDAAILATLPPGVYSAQLTGAGSDPSGVAMIELYDIPPTALETRWTMINVSPAEQQADCHLIEFPDGRRVLIDIADAADAEGSALNYLHAHDITRIDLVVLSHFHRDHYGRMLDLVRAGIQVGRVAFNMPSPADDLADAEAPWGFSRAEAWSVVLALEAKGIPCFTPQVGERLIECPLGDGTVAALDTICLWDGTGTPVGKTDVNDTSIILRLSHGKTRALFTGDLNYPLGNWLAQSNFDLSADVLKLPHHGTQGCAPPAFFDRVGARVAMVPSPRGLWESLRSKLNRDYYKDRNIPAFVNGIDGHVAVTLTADGFSVQTER